MRQMQEQIKFIINVSYVLKSFCNKDRLTSMSKLYFYISPLKYFVPIIKIKIGGKCENPFRAQ